MVGLRLGFVGLCIGVPFATVTARADDDPIRMKLDKDKASYDAAVKKTQEAAATWFSKREESARKAGDKKAVDQNRDDRLAFEEKGRLPASAPNTLKTRQAAARAMLDAAYRTAVREYTKASQDDKAAAVERERLDRVGSTGKPEDAVKFHGRFYKAFDQKLTWHEAKKACYDKGGRLIVVRSAEENEFFARLAAEAKLTAVWLGAHNEGPMSRWQWIDGSPFKYENWDRSAKQPNNAEGIEHWSVLITRRNGRWWDYPDDPNKHPRLTSEGVPGFICQWD